MASQNTTHPTPISFLDLPLEMKTQVLSNLPAREVQAARSICSEIRDVIDATGSRVLIHNPIRARAEAKINEELRALMWYPCPLSLRDYVFSFQKRRGIWKHPLKTGFAIKVASIQWAKLKMGETETAVDQQTFDKIVNSLFLIACLFAHAHDETYYPELKALRANSNTGFARLRALLMPNVSNIDEFYSSIDNLPFGFTLKDLAKFGLPLDREELGASYTEIIEKRVFGPTTAIPCAPSPHLAIPPYVLTKMVYFDERLGDIITGNPLPFIEPGICAVTQIKAILNVNSIPEPGNVFGFCLRTRKAHSLFVAALHGRVLAEWQKVAILEELYLF
ncbi:hypothetical protein CKM354_001003900 [Cercospora kikuchii]|uniref:F-box domain-containing protein n=1 Tax=Cercospora kikuchii TaxID=84275 RepID=A0A9P3FGX1_9PEZI|nr:uncharacterized protein CKM354_001003900 [Cercospora kikuchii]GIZ46936.1 hypothetical protein CKM354_001003900 [Cercospora kikuchii]